MSKLDQLKSLLQSKNLWAKKGLGQNPFRKPLKKFFGLSKI
jgi:hypothetical protein